MNDKITVTFEKKDGKWHSYLGTGTTSEGIPFDIFQQFLDILASAADKLNEKTDEQ